MCLLLNYSPHLSDTPRGYKFAHPPIKSEACILIVSAKAQSSYRGVVYRCLTQTLSDVKLAGCVLAPVPGYGDG